MAKIVLQYFHVFSLKKFGVEAGILIMGTILKGQSKGSKESNILHADGIASILHAGSNTK